MNQFFLGLDLGQAADYTALAVLQADGYEQQRTYQLRHLDRWRGVPYPKIVEKVRDVLLRMPPGSRLAFDQTGVGMAVGDLIRAAKLGAPLDPISIHGGDRVAEEDGVYRVPKRDLIGVLCVMLETSRLKIASGLSLARTLQEEARNFKVKIDAATAHDSYSSWRESEHDDLLLAVSMALWVGERHGVRVHAQAVRVAPSRFHRAF